MKRSYRRRPATPTQESQQPFFTPVMRSPLPMQSIPFFQMKGLKVGAPGDRYEQQADAMANAVVNPSVTTPAVQKQEISMIQRESLATPLEDEKLGTAEQRMEEDKLVQEKSELQTMGEEEEEKPLQTMEEEEEPTVQTKGEPGVSTTRSSLTHTIESSAGRGNPLPAKTKLEMQSAFGVDFSAVSVHTDAASVQMNRELSAQAFTHGRDIYFNEGKYRPETSGGKHLLAHELTHVVQQTTPGVQKTVQRQAAVGSGSGAPATTCGKPSDCPTDFCTPFGSTLEAIAARSAMAPILLAGIGAKVSPRVVPLWSQYLFGGVAPQDLTASFGGDFVISQTTADTTDFLVNELKRSLTDSPPTFPPGVTTVVVDISTLIAPAMVEIGTPGSAREMNFDVIGEIPGNIAGGIGDTQLSCPVGAAPSPFNDDRLAAGQVIIARNPDGTLTVFPMINYTVKDTIDLCPGNCGATIEQVATVPMSMMEASGIAGDVPFTVQFPSLPLAPFTITPATPAATRGITTASALRIRSRPDLSAAIVGKYPRGTTVDIVCQTTGSSVLGNTTWYQTDKGFVSGQYVTLSGSAPASC